MSRRGILEDSKDGAARKEFQKKNREEIYGCSQRLLNVLEMSKKYWVKTKFGLMTTSL